jgi:hypothetical protein
MKTGVQVRKGESPFLIPKARASTNGWFTRFSLAIQFDFLQMFAG